MPISSPIVPPVSVARPSSSLPASSRRWCAVLGALDDRAVVQVDLVFGGELLEARKGLVRPAVLAEGGDNDVLVHGPSMRRCSRAGQAHRVWRRDPVGLATLLSRRTFEAMPDNGPTVRLAAPSLRGVVRLVAIIAACAVGLYLVWRTRGVLRLAAIALFVALTLNQMVDALDRPIRIPRAAISLLLYVALAGGIVVTGAVVVPSTVRQVQQLSRDAPGYLHDLRRNATFRRYDDRYQITPKLQRDARALPRRLQRAAGLLQRVTVHAFGVVSQVLTVLSLAFLLMLHGREYMDMALRLTGDRRDQASARGDP
jgi:uncharacterized membrane protein YedE/YeeE